MSWLEVVDGLIPEQYILTLVLFFSTAITVTLLLIPTRFPKHRASVQVVVLGDIGRSPRMQYHALSLAKNLVNVELIGYQESDIHPKLLQSRFVKIVPLVAAPRWLQTSNKLLFLLLAPIKVVWQIVALYWVLAYRCDPAEWMLVQNPPSIPTLAVADIICYFRNTKLIIDWHNFGYSILGLKLGANHRLVAIAKAYERICARPAFAHLTVTDAMSRVLKRDFGLKALTLHDRPADHFKVLTLREREAVVRRLPQTKEFADEILQRRRFILVSPTSWTPDEDFMILLEALVVHSARVRGYVMGAPRLLVIITGKGPQKQYYEKVIKDLEPQLEHVHIETAWLSMEDYAALLGAADLGISLHTSSSGVDLPMKVVDMFGAGLPVAGWSEYESWPELVTEGVNGVGFNSAESLADKLRELLVTGRVVPLREGASWEGKKRRWEDEWNPVMGRLLGLTT
ncbi:hypothetical protein EJ06DRAFT_536970 [Trichodelitschia bisporula]|uniref:Chitobiosyldiphosphodolichol beta-mannosyltransferase n=1 Tax=Trichodelitschia bisporula TaxID=703511 RepID=A0A6G1I358_9PEZI|nr:hypothetical protein EJ06DRAFT_536970 [Trichodelitschia bisporula]